MYFSFLKMKQVRSNLNILETTKGSFLFWLRTSEYFISKFLMHPPHDFDGMIIIIIVMIENKSRKI